MRVKPGSSSDFLCGCCGGLTQTIDGQVLDGRLFVARYGVRWTWGRPEHGSLWIVTHQTGSPRSVALEARAPSGALQFMVIDGAASPWSTEPWAGKLLARSDVIGTALAAQTFAVTDAVIVHDERVARMRQMFEGTPTQNHVH